MFDRCVCDEPFIRCDGLGCQCIICGGSENRISQGLRKAIEDTRRRIAEASQPAATFRARLRPKSTGRAALAREEQSR